MYLFQIQVDLKAPQPRKNALYLTCKSDSTSGITNCPRNSLFCTAHTFQQNLSSRSSPLVTSGNQCGLFVDARWGKEVKSLCYTLLCTTTCIFATVRKLKKTQNRQWNYNHHHHHKLHKKTEAFFFPLSLLQYFRLQLYLHKVGKCEELV